MVVVAVVAGGAFLLLSGDDDDGGETVAHSGSDDDGPARPDFDELDKLGLPGAEDLGIDVDDFDPDNFDLDDLDPGNLDDSGPLGPDPDVDAGQPDTPPTGAADGFHDFLADECFGGFMFACDLLYTEAALGSDHQAYGDTCGGRLDHSAIPSCVDVLGEYA